MNKRIKRISLNQTAWTLGVMMFLAGILWAIIAIILGLTQQKGVAVLWNLLTPIYSFIGSYIGYFVIYWFYNIAASWTGGMEFDLVDRQQSKNQDIL